MTILTSGLRELRCARLKSGLRELRRARLKVGLHLLVALVSVWVGVVSAEQATEETRQMVEADWARHDAGWCAQLARPTLFRFPSGEVHWPGLHKADGAPIPALLAPAIDGRLSDACWADALSVGVEGQPQYRLSHDGERLYLAVTIPPEVEPRVRGDRTALDASGAVDGTKDGTYGFHTGGDADPWWQVDLGESQPIRRVVVYNRLDYAPGLNNANDITVLASDDGLEWREVYSHPGTFFGGIAQGGPLQVELEGVVGRYVRLQIPTGATGVLFHLDEVEVYGDQVDRNLALHRPARQSSLSIWSRGGPHGTSLATLAGHVIELTEAEPAQLLLDGQAVQDAVVARVGGALTVEAALPMFRGPVLQPAMGDSVTCMYSSGWGLAVHGADALGFGRNEVVLEVTGTGPLSRPVSLAAEVVTLTPQGFTTHTGSATTVQDVGRARLVAPALSEGPAVLRITARQGDFELRDERVFFVPPVSDTLERGRRILGELGLRAPRSLADLARRAGELGSRELRDGPDNAERAELYRQARWLVRGIALGRPELAEGQLLFVRKFTQQPYPDVCLNHMPWVSRPGGDICVLSPPAPDGRLRPLIDGRLGAGHVHGLGLSFDATKVVFGYAQSPSDEPAEGWLDRRTSYDLRRTVEPIHIFELGIDGTGLRQLTDGAWSDLDPCYLPNGDIAFVSERCGYSLQCNEMDKDETSCNLYVMGPDGDDVRRMSVTKDGDYMPHVLDNGLLSYTRWEYQERNWANIQSIWVIGPDGTGADALYKQHFNDPWGIEEARSIPDSPKLVAIATGHHTLPVGPVIIVDQQMGINNPAGIRIVTPGVGPPEGGMVGLAVDEGGVQGGGGLYGCPYPLSETTFLVSYTYSDVMTDERGYQLYLIDAYGTRELIYADPEMSSYDPVLLRPRPKPPPIADVRLADVPPRSKLATCVVTDIYDQFEGVERGQVKYLRISQRLPWPYDMDMGGMRYEPDVKSVMVNWTPARVLGTVPVEEDGSAHFQVPADTAVYFQALDEQQMELRRMRSFISFQPGEQRACSGCHETRGVAPASTHVPSALLRPPSPLKPAPWGDQAVSFLRDIQPVLDRRCVGCHSGLDPDGGLDFSGGLTASNNLAYDTITQHRLVARSNIGEDARITETLAFGSHRSRLIEVLRTTHVGRALLSEDERLRLVTWVDLNAPYHANFINKRPEVEPYDLANDAELRAAMVAVHERRCASCHDPSAVSRVDWVDLVTPAGSRFLAAPLSQEAGGVGTCPGGVYQSADDADYSALLARVETAVAEAWARPRRDVATLEPPSWAVVARKN